MAEFTPRHRAIRALLAAIDEPQFAALKASLEQNRAAIDARLAALDAEREQLALRKGQLDALLDRFGKPKAIDELRTAIVKGERLGTRLATIKPTAAKDGRESTERRPRRSGTATTPRRRTTPRE